MSEAISSVVQSVPGCQESRVDSQESDPLSWPEVSGLLVGLTFRDFLRYIEDNFSQSQTEYPYIFGCLPPSHRTLPNIMIGSIPSRFLAIELEKKISIGTLIEEFSGLVRWYIRQHVDHSGSL